MSSPQQIHGEPLGSADNQIATPDDQASTIVSDQGSGSTRSARGLTAATALSLGLRVLGVAVGMVTTSVLARHLDPGGYGVFSLALTLGAGAAQIADMGTAITVASRLAREKESAGRILGTGLALRSSVAFFATAILVAAAAFGFFGDSNKVVGIVALAVPLSAASILTAGATARFRPEISSALALIQGVLWLVAVSAVAAAGGSMLVLAWFFVGVTMLQTGIGIAMNRRVVPIGRPSFAEARRILSVSWPLALSSLAVMAYYRLDSLILFHAKGALELGYYSAAYKFIDVAQLGPSLLVAPLLPLAAASMSAGVGRRNTVLSLATRIGAVVGTGTAMMMIVLAPPLVRYLFGTDFDAAVKPLILLAVAFIGITFGWVGTTICSALGLTRPVAMVTVPVAVLSLGAQAWACPRWGAVGAAAVTAATELVIGGATCFLAARAMAARLPVKSLVTVLILGAATVLPMALLELPWMIESVLAAAMFGAALVATRVITTADIKRALSRRTL